MECIVDKGDYFSRLYNNVDFVSFSLLKEECDLLLPFLGGDNVSTQKHLINKEIGVWHIILFFFTLKKLTRDCCGLVDRMVAE